MKTKNKGLQLCKQGQLPLEKALETVTFTLQEMAAGKKMDCQMHTGAQETLFVFVANGICATLHLQSVQKGGLL